MDLNKYKSGDAVEVKIHNPQTNAEEWREGKVIGTQTVFAVGMARHIPYPMVVVKFKRTYCKAKPEYRYLEGTVKRIKIFVDNTLEFYTKETTEGFIFETDIKLKP